MFKESDAVEIIAKLLYKQAGYGDDYLLQFPNRAWGKIKPSSKEKWYWRAREIFNKIEALRNNEV